MISGGILSGARVSESETSSSVSSEVSSMVDALNVKNSYQLVTQSAWRKFLKKFL